MTTLYDEYEKDPTSMRLEFPEWAETKITAANERIRKLEARENSVVQEYAPEVLRLTKGLRYLCGIATRGEGRPIGDDETIEQFVLGYVKRLEAALTAEREVSDKLEKALKEAANTISVTHNAIGLPEPMALINARAALVEVAALRATHTNSEQADTPTTTKKGSN